MCILEFLHLTIKKSVFACLNIGYFTNSSIFNSKYSPSAMLLLFKFYQILLNYSHHCTVHNSIFLQTNLESPGKINFYIESAALNVEIAFSWAFQMKENVKSGHWSVYSYIWFCNSKQWVHLNVKMKKI